MTNASPAPGNSIIKWGMTVEEKMSKWIDYVQNNIWKNEKVH